ncbi:MAG: hypothetical protein WAL75_08805 [Terracidiphilus sp.]
MTLRNTLDTHRWIVPVVRLVGLAIFVLAFFEPAVTREGQNYAGWKCASVAMSFAQNLLTKSGGHHESFEYLGAMSGLINPLIVFALLASPIRALAVLRRIFGVLVVLCMIATWALFSQQQIAPLIGHFLWIAGALIVLAPDAVFGGKQA